MTPLVIVLCSCSVKMNIELISLNCAIKFLVDVLEDDSLMDEEIFGPVLPFVTVRSAESALQFIKQR